jgi:hypothetical protein
MLKPLLLRGHVCVVEKLGKALLFAGSFSGYPGLLWQYWPGDDMAKVLAFGLVLPLGTDIAGCCSRNESSEDG